MRRRSRWAWAPTSPSSTVPATRCGGSSAQFGTGVRTIYSTRATIAELVKRADLLIGAVLVPGAAAPKLVTRAMLSTMKPGAVIVDVAIDQGGCCETSKATTHSNPTYVVDGVVHYCVANMPGAVARTSTFALNNATLPFALAIADKGWRQALKDDAHLRDGLNVHDGKLDLRARRFGASIAVHAGHGRAVGLVRRGLTPDQQARLRSSRAGPRRGQVRFDRSGRADDRRRMDVLQRAAPDERRR